MRMNRVGRQFFGSSIRSRMLRDTVTPALLRLGGSLAGCRVLEIGAGVGSGAQLILGLLGAESVHALDLDPLMLRRARSSGRPIAKLIADMSAIPAADSVYDAVVNYGALHLADNWRGALREVARVVRPGGRLFFEQPINPLSRFAFDRAGGGRIPGGFGRVELLEAIERSGFTMIGVQQVGFGRLDLVGAAQRTAS